MTSDQARTGRRRVLVVEDTMIVADEIVRMLDDLGCEVVGPVPTLEQAEAAASDEDVDAALLDVNLNGEPVFSAAEILLLRGVPLVFLTGYARSSLPPEHRDRPCLEKPFSFRELANVLEESAGMVLTR